MITRNKVAKIKNECEDNTNRKYIEHMCNGCRFYNKTCSKRRNVRDCAKKGLKNK